MFCSECQSALSVERKKNTATRICPKCGAQVKGSSTDCYICKSEQLSMQRDGWAAFPWTPAPKVGDARNRMTVSVPDRRFAPKRHAAAVAF